MQAAVIERIATTALFLPINPSVRGDEMVTRDDATSLPVNFPIKNFETAQIY